MSCKHGSRIRRLARPGRRLATNVLGLARPEVSRQTFRKDRRTYFPLFFLVFFHACRSSFYPLVRYLYLLCFFNLSLYKLPEEVSRKRGSRNRRLATDVSQGQAYLLSSVIMLVHLPSLWFGTCTSFISLTCLCTSYLKKCLASTGLATDVSQGQTSRNRRLARTDSRLARPDVSQQTSRKDRRT